MSAAAWIVPSSISSGVLIVSLLTYRIVRRQNAVSWAAEVKPYGNKNDVELLLRRRGGPPARNVRVTWTPSQQHLMLGPGANGRPATVPQVDAGGHISLIIGIQYAVPPLDSVEVSWDRWLRVGPRKRWRSQL